MNSPLLGFLLATSVKPYCGMFTVLRNGLVKIVHKNICVATQMHWLNVSSQIKCFIFCYIGITNGIYSEHSPSSPFQINPIEVSTINSLTQSQNTRIKIYNKSYICDIGLLVNNCFKKRLII